MTLRELTTDDLNRKAASLRNHRDAFSAGSPHADEAVQELARVNRELERRRDERSAAWQAHLALPIEELELGVVAYNVLKRMGVDTFGELLKVTPADLENFRPAGCVYNRARAAADVAAAQDRVKTEGRAS